VAFCLTYRVILKTSCGSVCNRRCKKTDLIGNILHTVFAVYFIPLWSTLVYAYSLHSLFIFHTSTATLTLANSGDRAGHDAYVMQTAREPSALIVRPLRDYQLIGVNWLLAMYDLRAGCILADELALGKKVQVIAYMAQLSSCQNVWGPHLVVTLTGCLPAWSLEFERWFPSAKTCVYYGVSFSKHGHLHDRKHVSIWSHISDSVVVVDAVIFANVTNVNRISIWTITSTSLRLW